MTTEADLREQLTRLAEATAPREDPFLAGRIAALSRSRRRRRIGLTALVASVAAVVIAVPVVLSGSGAEPSRSAPADGPTAVDVLAGPTRGSLAGDAAFLEGVRQLPWVGYGSGPVPDPPVDTRRVVWAGDVPGGRWALVVGDNTARPVGEEADPERQTDLDALSDVAMLWFAGPPGADATQMGAASVAHGVDVTRPVAFTTGTEGVMVVIAAPGDTVEFSRRPDVAADATVSRAWEPAGTTDGVAVLSLGEGSGEPRPAVRYRVLRDGAEVVVSVPESFSAWGDAVVDAEVEWLRGGPEPSPGVDPVARRAQQVSWLLGLPADAVRFAVVWAGPVPSPDERRAEVSLLAATLPSGAVYLQADAMLSAQDGSVAGAGCGSALQAAGPPLAERTFVLSCSLPFAEGGTPGRPSLVVVAPPSATTARLLDADGEELGSSPLRDGVVVADVPAGLTTVQTLAADGTVLAETAPMGNVDWDE
ncbi:hypothetical protein [Trujillonella endophytica]|uniref:Uncharacterized protein n=1 Tax=Trujillonella endophytica TaxID=673521 RepID=A0A1H8TU75_9ACTN|nr:hypothetical protein [Trujillella endophytica]SEO94421.1 hypothetical protein SAMN05660991_02448 [Trujillella endophytica]